MIDFDHFRNQLWETAEGIMSREEILDIKRTDSDWETYKGNKDKLTTFWKNLKNFGVDELMKKEFAYELKTGLTEKEIQVSIQKWYDETSLHGSVAKEAGKDFEHLIAKWSTEMAGRLPDNRPNWEIIYNELVGQVNRDHNIGNYDNLEEFEGPVGRRHDHNGYWRFDSNQSLFRTNQFEIRGAFNPDKTQTKELLEKLGWTDVQGPKIADDETQQMQQTQQTQQTQPTNNGDNAAWVSEMKAKYATGDEGAGEALRIYYNGNKYEETDNALAGIPKDWLDAAEGRVFTGNE